MGLLWLVVVVVIGYAAFRLLADPDVRRRKAALKTILGYVVTAALCVVAFRSGLPWLLAVIGAGYLATRALPKLQQYQSKQHQERSHTGPEPGVRPRRAAAMTRHEALDVLGLEEGASKTDINARYRELMRKVHPDQGGSSYLATRINEARRVLLG